jgi:hypothetical protein
VPAVTVAAAGGAGGHGERHYTVEGDVARYQMHFLIDAFFPGGVSAALAHAHGAVHNLKLVDGKIGSGR